MSGSLAKGYPARGALWRSVRMQQAVLSFSVERTITLPTEAPDAYFEWGAPTDFNVDNFDQTKGDDTYKLGGDYFEEAREYRDEFIAQSEAGSGHVHNYFGRTLTSISFRGPRREQVVMTFTPTSYEISHPNVDERDPYQYKMVENNGDLIRTLLHEGEEVPVLLPHETPFQWYNDTVDTEIFE